MTFHAAHFSAWWPFSVATRELVFLVGVAAGRQKYEPFAKWLYSFRVMLGVFKVEVLWTTGAE